MLDVFLDTDPTHNNRSRDAARKTDVFLEGRVSEPRLRLRGGLVREGFIRHEHRSISSRGKRRTR